MSNRPSPSAKSLANLRPAKKGEVRNPTGKGGGEPVYTALRKLTKTELADVGSIIVKGDIEALKAIPKDPSSSVIKVMVATVAMKIISKGDMDSLDKLLNRLIGKVKDEVELTGADGGPMKIQAMEPEQRRELIEKYTNVLKETE